jgi:2Fe-2S type ferredoxin
VAVPAAEITAPAASPPAELRSGNDSPTRAAHLRPTFGTTTGAFNVHVYSEPEKLDIRFSCEPGEYIVEAAERAGFELPSSCRNGGCLTCTGKLMEGEAEIIEDQYVLEDHQIAAGFRLLCITTPRSDVVFMSHQQEEL